MYQLLNYPNQFVLDKDGDVGINVSVPVEKLHVNGDILLQNGNPLLKLKTTSIISTAKTGIQFNGPSSNNANISYTDGALFLSGRDTTAAGNVISDLVLRGGNTGLGISTPQEKLHIGGNALLSFANPTIQFQQLATDKGFIQLDGDNLRVGTNSSNTNGKFVIRTGGADQVIVDKDGNMGFGVSPALSKIQILNGNGVSISTHGYLMLGSVTSSNVIFDNNEIMARNNGSTGHLILQRQGGAVRIGGTAAPSGYKFAVDGKMICEEVKVKLASSGWPDYVFDTKYRLQSLSEVEKFINANKHLPNIPSAAEVEKNGIELGDMQKRMMEKIEELTLYIISLKKEIDVLKVNNEK